MPLRESDFGHSTEIPEFNTQPTTKNSPELDSARNEFAQLVADMAGAGIIDSNEKIRIDNAAGDLRAGHEPKILMEQMRQRLSDLPITVDSTTGEVNEPVVSIPISERVAS